MYKILLVLLIMATTQLFAFSDIDMDGVEDKNDRCPNTPMSDLVDINGCSKKTLKIINNYTSLHHFDIIVGVNYSSDNYDKLEESDTSSSSLQLDYYYKNFSIQASTSYYDSHSVTYNDNGIADSFLGAYYKFTPIQNLDLRVGGGAIIPTYNSELKNNNTDYTASLSLSYMFKKINLFGGYNYVMVNDDDTDSVQYQNTNGYNIGIGFYPSLKTYISASYNKSNSIYTNIDDIDTASLYGFYSINNSWFTTLNYAYGLSDTASDNYLSLRVGYYF